MLKLFNSYSDKIEEFKTVEEGKVKMYVCGPTVYDNPHLGHARCYITWDVLYRYLKFLGYNVIYCRNVTDVDDKILARSEKEGILPDEVAKKYYAVFVSSMKKLNVSKPDIEPFATKNLGEMIAIIKTLIEKGFAYEVDGDVYFRVKKFEEYGRLSNQPIDDLMRGARVEASSIKENPLDFALWKKDEKNGYKSPWGIGRPGWHIECSAMAKKHLGETIDIHAGGADLVFPHHENEIAQSKCANDKPFANFWLHNGFVTVNKEKMSKSLGNFLTIDDILKNYNSNTIRFFILTNHYRMPVEFSDEALASAQAGAKRLQNAVNNIMPYAGDIAGKADEDRVLEFKEAMNDDLNTSKALAILFELANDANRAKEEGEKVVAANMLAALLELSNILGFDFSQIELDENTLFEKISPVLTEFDFVSGVYEPKEILDKIIAVRNKARIEKNWAQADFIRDTLAKTGVSLKDSKDGTSWHIE